MTVEVEILSSNVEVLEKQPPLELLPFSDFLEITSYMVVKETVTFQLLEVGGDPFYRGTFEKTTDDWTLEQDVQHKLNQLVKKKKMSIDQAEELLKKIDSKGTLIEQPKRKSKLSQNLRPTIGKKKEKPRSKKRTWFPSFSNSTYLKMGLLLLVGTILSVGLFSVLTANEPVEQKATSYEQLLSEKRYEEALKKYPDKEQTIIEQAYKNEDKKSLETLKEKASTDQASLYLAFLEKDWKTATTLKNLPTTSDILAMKGYAFLQQGKVEEAQLINKELKNQTLTDQIKAYQKEQAYQAIHKEEIDTAEKINKEINDSQLSEDIKIARSIENLLQKYQKEQKNKKLSENDRKEASKNYELWKKNLQQVGNE
ncbi:hypothetical protein D929_00174 [Enterococcus faecalis 02-MB-P-10]|uniref:hypothetical protein n=1 Tax=Enterococcus faecalis TaxID=1351 RepID=UPI0003547060|nr:hypothetical protein [Enterococcus faecalis]EPH77105.1 hypothetical protein D929_00174 [Enterococcus faecalis 02-MB-P-10]